MAFKLAIVKSFGRTLGILVDANRPGCSTDLSSVRKHTCSGQFPQADGEVGGQRLRITSVSSFQFSGGTGSL